MKRITLFFFALFAIMIAKAQSTLPEFSTEENPVWYTVQFKAGGDNIFLSDKGAGQKMKTKAGNPATNEQFQFIGTSESYKMKSKAGNWVGFKDRFVTGNKDQAAELKMVKGSAEGYWEIHRVANANNGMNQWGGAGNDKELGEWGTGDINNQLFFNIKTTIWPEFSTEDGTKEKYYFVRFLCNKGCASLSTNGTDNCIRIYAADPADAQMWKLVGTKDNFQLVNKTGVYAIVSNEPITPEVGGLNSNPIRSSKTKDPNGFQLVESTNGQYGSGFEIVAIGKSGNNHWNKWGGDNNNNTIGFWQANDGNNVLTFVDPDKMEYADCKSTGIEGYVPANDLTLWYTEPATTARLYAGGQGYSNWMEYALPIGDGQFGASLFGGIKKDEIQFNEKTLWSGRSTDLSGGGSGYGKYENFGSLYAEYIGSDIDYSSKGGVTNYYRQLDLSNATGKVSFQDKNGVTYTREYIASNPARVVAARYTASEAGKINLRFSLASGKPGVVAATTYEADGGVFSGKLETVSYNARFKVVPMGGTMKQTAEGIEVKDADEVLVILAGGTDFDAYEASYIKHTAQLATTIQARVNDAAKLSWNALYDAHVKDFQKFFNRVDFQLAGTKNQLPTNKLIDAYNGGKGADALMLEKLYFAYGRYLEISSSRGVDLPANLQGIWSNITNPAWNADIHANINVQMNYWPAEPTNLSEMHLPFINYIWNMAENHNEWKKYAQMSGQNRGWTCFTENNIFGGGSKFASNYVIANAWYCTHLWQHYRYTLDKEYLKKVFPAMLSATYFWLDRLILAQDGTYEAPKEWSPEHGPGSENGVAHAQQLVYDLFDNTLKAIEVIGQDVAKISDEDLNKLKDRFTKLDKGLHIEMYDGQWGDKHNNLTKGNPILREWKYSPYTATGDKHHRHMSHLMCLYPFSQVHPGTGLFDAAVNSMLLRGDGATGWSMGWKINLWARALDGDHARTILNNALRHANGGAGVFYNLFDSHAPFQIDGNFGACAGIAEMIMQSNADTIRILPALPTAWKDGHMKGLKAVKDFTVDIDWKAGKATRVMITNNKGQAIPVLYKHLKDATVYVNDKKVTLAVDNKGVATLESEAGSVYIFDFDGSYKPTGIQQAQKAQLEISLKDNLVKVTGKDVKKVNVYDLQGRLVKTSNKASFRVNTAADHVLVIEVTDADNKVTTKRVAVL